MVRTALTNTLPMIKYIRLVAVFMSGRDCSDFFCSEEELDVDFNSITSSSLSSSSLSLSSSLSSPSSSTSLSLSTLHLHKKYVAREKKKFNQKKFTKFFL